MTHLTGRFVFFGCYFLIGSYSPRSLNLWLSDSALTFANRRSRLLKDFYSLAQRNYDRSSHCSHWKFGLRVVALNSLCLLQKLPPSAGSLTRWAA